MPGPFLVARLVAFSFLPRRPILGVRGVFEVEDFFFELVLLAAPDDLVVLLAQAFEAVAELVHAGALRLGERVNLRRVEDVYAPDRDDAGARVALFAVVIPKRDLPGVFR